MKMDEVSRIAGLTGVAWFVAGRSTAVRDYVRCAYRGRDKSSEPRPPFEDFELCAMKRRERIDARGIHGKVSEKP